MSIIKGIRNLILPTLFIAMVSSVYGNGAEVKNASSVKVSGLGIIKGVIRDQAGSAIADATVAIFRTGTTRALKQVTSAPDGSFIARIIPGTYTIMAVAEGFNPVTLNSVDVARSAELVYGFKLARAGSGNTLPEKLKDRHSSKWTIRAANAQRAIYQNASGKAPVDESTAGQSTAELQMPEADEPSPERKGQTAVETYFASGANGNYAGLNFATLLPVTAKAEIVLAGQASTSRSGPSLFETQVKYRASSKHQLRASGSVARLGTVDN